MLTPALCATHAQADRTKGDHARRRRASSAGSTAASTAAARATSSGVRGILARTRPLHGGLRRAGGVMVRAVPAPAHRLPAAGGPGHLFAMVSAPAGATQERTLQVGREARAALPRRTRRTRSSGVHRAGLQLRRPGQNTGMAFVKPQGLGRAQGAGAARRGGRRARDGRAHRRSRTPWSSPSRRRRCRSSASPPASTFYLKDNGGLGHEALTAARNQFLGLAAQSQAARQRAPERPGGHAAAPHRHRPRRRRPRSACRSPTSTPRCRRPGAASTSTTSSTAAA